MSFIVVGWLLIERCLQLFVGCCLVRGCLMFVVRCLVWLLIVYGLFFVVVVICGPL